MKKYFIKFLPSPNWNNEIKPMMCSHDIKEGDTYYHLDPTGDTKGYFAKEVISVGGGITNIYPNGKNKLGHTNTKMYKVEGEISSSATWLKEGDKFGKNDVNFTEKYTRKRAKSLEDGDPVIFDYQGDPLSDKYGIISKIVYKVTEFGIGQVWDWDDEIHITNVKQQNYLDSDDDMLSKPIIKDCDDLVKKRCEVEFKGSTYLYFEVKCSKCKHLH